MNIDELKSAAERPRELPPDIEAELQGVCMTLADDLWRKGIITRGDEEVALHLESRIRPVLLLALGLKPKEQPCA
jgi:hypothetical protein